MVMMKYIKNYNIFENSNSNLELRLKEFNIKRYTINDDGAIDVDDVVYISYKNLVKIPFNFGKITNSFDCRSNNLESLLGCPTEVGGDFICAINKLKSLEFCPLEIGENLYCTFNYLTMLDCSSYVKGNIYCRDMFKTEPEFFGDCEGKIIWE